jgi:hypothetical protein
MRAKREGEEGRCSAFIEIGETDKLQQGQGLVRSDREMVDKEGVSDKALAKEVKGRGGHWVEGRRESEESG